MEVHFRPEEFPTDEEFHTVHIESTGHQDYNVRASNNEHICVGTVGSVGIAGESAGMSGYVKLEAAASRIKLDYVDFTEEYGYDEIQVVFTD